MHAVRAMKGQPLAGLTMNDERGTINDEREDTRSVYDDVNEDENENLAAELRLKSRGDG